MLMLMSSFDNGNWRRHKHKHKPSTVYCASVCLYAYVAVLATKTGGDISRSKSTRQSTTKMSFSSTILFKIDEGWHRELRHVWYSACAMSFVYSLAYACLYACLCLTLVYVLVKTSLYWLTWCLRLSTKTSQGDGPSTSANWNRC